MQARLKKRLRPRRRLAKLSHTSSRKYPNCHLCSASQLSSHPLCHPSTSLGQVRPSQLLCRSLVRFLRSCCKCTPAIHILFKFESHIDFCPVQDGCPSLIHHLSISPSQVPDLDRVLFHRAWAIALRQLQVGCCLMLSLDEPSNPRICQLELWQGFLTSQLPYRSCCVLLMSMKAWLQYWRQKDHWRQKACQSSGMAIEGDRVQGACHISSSRPQMMSCCLQPTASAYTAPWSPV